MTMNNEIKNFASGARRGERFIHIVDIIIYIIYYIINIYISYIYYFTPLLPARYGRHFSYFHCSLSFGRERVYTA